MSRRIAFDEPQIGVFVASRAPCNYNPMVDTTIGVVDDDRPIDGRVRGGVIYTNYTGASVFMHVAGMDEGWITPDMLTLGFRYPFMDLGCAAVFGTVECANDHAMRIYRSLGFHVVARLPHMFASGDGFVITMTRDECRFYQRSLRTVRPKSLAWN